MKIKKAIALALSMIIAVSAVCPGISAAEKTKKTVKTVVKDSEKSEKTPDNNTAAVTIKAKSVILCEQSTGKILYEVNSHEKLRPASITKIMTELLVLEAIENGALKWDDKISCSEHAASMGGSDIWLKPGEIMNVNDLFKAMAIYSANDAAVALAEKVGGTEQAFVNMMNEKAKELGMKDTHFVNANGLDAEGHLSSAYDVMLMSRELIKHKKIFDFCTIWMDKLRDGKTALYNTNKLIRFYSGANGLKTGSTGKAGYCVSATALRNNMQLIAVTMGSDSSDDRFNTAKHLLDYGFTNWAVVKPKIGNDKMTVHVLKGVQKTVDAAASDELTALVKKGSEKKIEQKVSLVPDVMAPVEKGQVLGTISVFVDGEKIGSIPLKAKEAVPKLTFGVAFLAMFRAMVAG